MSLAIFISLLEIDVTNRVNNQDFAILSNNSLPRPSCSNRRRRCRRGFRSLDALGLLLELVFLGILLLHPPLSPVHRLPHGFPIISRGNRRSGSPSSPIQTWYTQIITPSSMPGELDIPSHELLLSLPAHIKRKPMSASTNEDEQPSQNRAQPRSEACIVITSPFPLRKSIAQEMVVALPARSSQDVGHYAQARETIAGSLGRGLDFGLGGAFGDVDSRLLLGLGLVLVLASRFVGDELLLDFVWMQESGLLAVGLVYVILVCVGFQSQEIVECDAEPFCGFDFISQTEDLLVCGLLLVIRVGHQEGGTLGRNLPSLLQAATRVSKQAIKPTVKSDSLILLVVLRFGHTADVSAL